MALESSHFHRTGIALTRANDLVMVKDTPKGRGIFATGLIKAGTVVETCPVLILPVRDLQAVTETELKHYTYNWPVRDPATGRVVRTQAVSLGLGSIFNHSTREFNVIWARDLEEQVIEYRAVRDVGIGEELCISYGRLWFKDTDAGTEEGEDDIEALGRIAIDM